MASLYIYVLVIVCAANQDFIGDHDSGATCLQFFDHPVVYYPSVEACSRRGREIMDFVKSQGTQAMRGIPGPYTWKVQCIQETISEVGW